MEFSTTTIITILGAALVPLAGFAYALGLAQKNATKDALTLSKTWGSNWLLSLTLPNLISAFGLNINLLNIIMAAVMTTGLADILMSPGADFLVPASFSGLFLIGWWALTYAAQWYLYYNLYSGHLNGTSITNNSVYLGWAVTGLFGAMSIVSFLTVRPFAGLLFAVHTVVSGYLAYIYQGFGSAHPQVK